MSIFFYSVLQTRVGLIKHPTNTTIDLAFWKSNGLNTMATLNGREGNLPHDPASLCVRYEDPTSSMTYSFSNSDCTTPEIVTCDIC